MAEKIVMVSGCFHKLDFILYPGSSVNKHGKKSINHVVETWGFSALLKKPIGSEHIL